MWNATCPDTFAYSYLVLVTFKAGLWQHMLKKESGKIHLNPIQSLPLFFSPVAKLKQLGYLFLRNLVIGFLLQLESSDYNLSSVLQRLVAVQRGNATSVSGTHLSSDIFISVFDTLYCIPND